ncbi:hypothetical protein EX30DRAFT_344589 [Ascodesmis nigricans]|uniref:Uncharacterized protein n=1 Tax=Ascodesmis nigricans TaxID=341454 RepID=A0A4S2MIT4_9PEZI|nr:hypothetical protein EX30DRAFT_344589 [Ascodesmis nigricans]
MMLSSPASSALDSSPLRPDEPHFSAWYTFKTADLREMEKKKDSGFPNGGLQQVLRTYNISLSRQPDLTNLAPNQQYLELRALKQQHIDTAVRVLADMGVTGIKAKLKTPSPKTASKKNHEQSRQYSSPDFKHIEDDSPSKRLGHPKWTYSKVAQADFVPTGPGTMDSPTPQTKQDPVIVSASPPSAKKLPPHLKTRENKTEKQHTEQAEKNKNVSEESQQKGSWIPLDPRLRSHTIEYQPASADLPVAVPEKRPERSSSSPPKIAYSQIAQTMGPPTLSWNPSWYGSSRTASGESTDKASSIGSTTRKPVKLTKPDGTPILPGVYKVPQRRPEHHKPEPAGYRSLPATQCVEVTPTQVIPPPTGSPHASNPVDTNQPNSFIGEPQDKGLIDQLKEEIDRRLRIEIPLNIPRAKAPVPTYPPNAPIPGPPRIQPYTNVIPRMDQMNSFGHGPPGTRPVPHNYPPDLLGMKRRGNNHYQPQPVPYEMMPMEYPYTPYYDQNIHPRSPGHKVLPRFPQYEPRYGAVRNGRDVRTGHGMPHSTSSRDNLQSVEEPEDYELQIMHNIPYRLRAVPLTGPRCIR